MSVSREAERDPAAERDAELRAREREIAQLRAALAAREREILRLALWLQSLQRDIHDVYQSVTWRIGDTVARAILKILRKPVGPTARDHVARVAHGFALWKERFFGARARESAGFLPYLPWHPSEEYQRWLARYANLSPEREALIHAELRTWQTPPRFSVLVPVPEPHDPAWLRETLASLSAQLYPAWEAWVLAEEPSAVAQTGDARIRVLACAAGETRAARLNRALRQATGEFALLLDGHDRLAPDALFQAAYRIRQYPETELLYSDEDKLDAAGARHDPYFKSDWNPDLFYAQNFLEPSGIFRLSSVGRIGGFCEDCPGQEVYDLALRLLEAGVPEARIQHLPLVLYHRRCPSLEADGAELARKSDGACAALRGHFQRQGRQVTLEAAPGGHTRVAYPLPAPPPLVSIVVPTRDRLSLLRDTLQGILHGTDYPEIEVIVVDNASREPETLAYLAQIQREDARVKVIRDARPFNYSRLNNLGAAHARGEILGLLNNDLRVIAPGWLAEMVGHALRPEIGAVGAKLYYADDSVQHAGVVVGLGGMAGHGLKHVPRAAPAYHWKPFLVQNYSAVTAACLVLRRAVFAEVGGLEERHLPVAFNDVDLCLRLREQGYRILWTPYAELYHLESASRGADDTFGKYRRLQRELDYMRKRWRHRLAYDPYYNPNLTVAYEDYALAYPPRSFPAQWDDPAQAKGV